MRFENNKYLWAIRDVHSRELIMLVRSNRHVSANAVYDTVCSALPDGKLYRRLMGSFDLIPFTVAEWETWFAFELAPAIELYMENPEKCWKWKWKSITA